jgi:hypothetical protein
MAAARSWLLDASRFKMEDAGARSCSTLLVAPSNETFIRMRKNQRRGYETCDRKIDSMADCVNRLMMGTNFRWGGGGDMLCSSHGERFTASRLALARAARGCHTPPMLKHKP